MESAPTAERISVVPDIDPLQVRVDALEEELSRHPDITYERLAKAAGLSYQTWRNVVTGSRRRPSTVERFEQALRDLIEHPEDIAEEPTHVVAPSPSELIEFEVTGDFGVRVVVRGPVGDSDAIERAAARIIRDIRRSQEADRGDE